MTVTYVFMYLFNFVCEIVAQDGQVETLGDLVVPGASGTPYFKVTVNLNWVGNSVKKLAEFQIPLYASS